MTSKTSFIANEAPANALALNSDNSQVVIAGRNGMRVDVFTETARRQLFNYDLIIF